MPAEQLAIPTDWTEEDGYILYLVCCPNSAQWQGALKGQIWKLATGRFWNERTGTVTEARDIGREIWNSLMTCKLDDLVAAFDTLNVTIQAQQQALADIVAALGEVKTAIEAADLEDDLANVWGTLEEINTVLGGTNGQPPEPL